MNKLDELKLQEAMNTDESWSVKNNHDVNWALGMIKALHDQKEENISIVHTEIERLQDWLSKENEQAESSINFFQSRIEEYYATLLESDEKARIKVPNGLVSKRKQPAKWHYTEQTVDELERAGLTDYIRVRKDVDRTGLKEVLHATEDGKVISPTGEILETIAVEPESYKTTVRLN